MGFGHCKWKVEMKPYQSSVMRRFVNRGNMDIGMFYRQRRSTLIAEWTDNPPAIGNLRDLKHRAELAALADDWCNPDVTP
jgi:hypothetical protein